jgi:hypothetical protein
MARNPRKPVPTRRGAAPVEAEPEVLEERRGGLDVDSGMVLITTLLLIVAIVLAWKELGSHYGAGPLG